MSDPSFRRAVAEIAPSVRQLSDRDLRAFSLAITLELVRREGSTVAAEWIQTQATRLRTSDALTVEANQ